MYLLNVVPVITQTEEVGSIAEEVQDGKQFIEGPALKSPLFDLTPWKTGTRLDHSPPASPVGSTMTDHKIFMYDGFPFVFHNPDINRTAIICLVQKGGSTTWKQAILKFFSEHNSTFKEITRERLFNSMPHTLYKRADLPKSYPTMEQAASDPNVARFMFVRNPYSRLLSGFREKVETRQVKSMYPRGYDDSTGFPGFVDALVENGLRVNNHFTPLSTACGLPQKFHYDYYLKVEHLDLWYEPFVDYLGLKESVSSGWNITTKWFSNPYHHDCFFSKAGCTCENMFTEKCPRPTGYDSSAKLPFTFHATHSKADILNQYYTEDTTEKVTQYYGSDFKEFQYGQWTGKNDSIYHYKQF